MGHWKKTNRIMKGQIPQKWANICIAIIVAYFMLLISLLHPELKQLKGN